MSEEMLYGVLHIKKEQSIFNTKVTRKKFNDPKKRGGTGISSGQLRKAVQRKNERWRLKDFAGRGETLSPKRHKSKPNSDKIKSKWSEKRKNEGGSREFTRALGAIGITARSLKKR